MFGLETDVFILLFISLFAACAFEFVNGFHDTANAVATVIYTNSLKPTYAVVWSGICNFTGVLLGGIGVAMGIVNLLPVELLVDQNVYHSVAMVMALLLSAIIWNLGTWYFGLPSSSSHTLIGSILGVGLAFATMPDNITGAAVNWEKAIETGYALLLSPLLGFSLAIVLMFVLRRSVPDDVKDALFKEPKKNSLPPSWIRGILIATCSLVSFFHGSNDGQKGVGLIMLILIGIVPYHFAVQTNLDPRLMQTNIGGIEQTIAALNSNNLSPANRDRLVQTRTELTELKALINGPLVDNKIPNEKRLDVRKDLLLINSNMKKIAEDEGANLSANQLSALNKNLGEESGLRRFTDYAPLWVILMIAISLGLGTMIGWRRIVVTVGEKIGKQHLTYAQGASAELVAAMMIGLASALKLPVSTTHVLSSGIAGSMVANKGVKNLQAGTVRNIALAWVLTLPVSVLLSFTLYIFFRWVL
ncbi:inorganic phosphate transporter [Spirosoma endophyticum]|uniref:Phosphate transporter n=1 Tax=Spirosoma endophyticum TaxID=662367 RepID=A0A1I1TIX3_9BACT|nr:inorganic phosphate transporter [Spirosoma endophyticum]SFD57098.1 inorganic phosphate transporter, PiT family [Spirosoma endophyticum]